VKRLSIAGSNGEGLSRPDDISGILVRPNRKMTPNCNKAFY
jgi:hypothetical protein